jgi:hypothetical protein
LTVVDFAGELLLAAGCRRGGVFAVFVPSFDFEAPLLVRRIEATSFSPVLSVVVMLQVPLR